MKRWPILLLLLFCSVAQSSEESPQTRIQADIVSAYAWRGRVLSEEAYLHPNVSVQWGEFSLGLAGFLDLADASGPALHERVDATLRYTTRGDGHYTAIGGTAYVYVSDANDVSADTAEIFLVYGADIMLLPTIVVSYDVLEADGAYVEASLGHSFELSDDIALDCRLALGWADEKYAEAQFALPPDAARGFAGFVPEDSILTELTIEAVLPITVGKGIELQPGITYTTSLDGELRDALTTAGEDTDQLIFSVSLGSKF